MAAEKGFSDYVEMTRRSAEAGSDEAVPEHAWVAAAVLLVVLVPIVLYLAWVIWWEPRRKALRLADPRTMDLVGEAGVARTDLGPEGTCEVLGQAWPCRADGFLSVPSGTPILVVGYEGERFIVAPRSEEAPS